MLTQARTRRTASSWMKPDVQREYTTLLDRMLPMVITSDAQNERYTEELATLLRSPSRTPAERSMIDLLTILIENFEERYALPKASPTQVIEFLMDQHDMKQKDLAKVFGSKSVVSEVLGGKRELNKTHIERLSQHFHVSPEVFF